MRTTGLATGLDTDTIIKQMLTPYQSRVDSAKQSKDIILLKQQLYRDVAKDINSLYSKYMDVNSTSNLLLTTNYKTSVFKSSNDLAVSAEGLAGAKVGNYKVNVTEVAKPAQITEAASNLGDKKFDVLVNGKAVEINLIGDTDSASIVKKINDAFRNAGVDTRASESTLSGKIVIESKNAGATETLQIVEFSDKTAAMLSGINVSDVKGKVFNININGTIKSVDLTSAIGLTNDQVIERINNSIGNLGNAQVDGSGNINIKTSITGDGTKISATIREQILSDLGTDTEEAIVSMPLSELKGKSTTFIVNGKQVKLDLTTVPDAEVEKKINDTLSGVLNVAIDPLKNIEFKTKNIGIAQEIKVVDDSTEVVCGTSVDGYTNGKIENPLWKSTGTDIQGTISDTYGNTKDISSVSGGKNVFTVDNVKFTITDKTNGDVLISGKEDNTEFVKNIKAFVEEYNKLVSKVHSLVNEKKQYTYKPLTEEQKKEMSEEEIKLWNEKTKQGLLKNDDILRKLDNDLRQCFSTPMDGKMLSSIGITFNKDYNTKSGQLVVDETKLSKALSEDSSEVLKMFTKMSDPALSGSEKYKNTGIMQRLKDTLNEAAVKPTSKLLTKAGLEGRREYDNDLYKSILKKEKEIKDLEKLLKIKENAYYTKFATLEKVMNGYNSQQAWLTQQFGGGQ